MNALALAPATRRLVVDRLETAAADLAARVDTLAFLAEIHLDGLIAELEEELVDEPEDGRSPTIAAAEELDAIDPGGCRYAREAKRVHEAWRGMLRRRLEDDAPPGPPPPPGPVVTIGRGHQAPAKCAGRVPVIVCWHGTFRQPDALVELVRVVDESRLRNPAAWLPHLTGPAGERVGFRLELWPAGTDDWPTGAHTLIGQWSSCDPVPDLEAPPVPRTVRVLIPGIGHLVAHLAPVQPADAFTTYEITLEQRARLAAALRSA